MIDGATRVKRDTMTYNVARYYQKPGGGNGSRSAAQRYFPHITLRRKCVKRSGEQRESRSDTITYADARCDSAPVAR